MEKFKVFHLKGYDYKFNKILLWSSLIIISILLIFTLAQDKFSGKTNYYTYCPTSERAGCFNAFYQSNLCTSGKIDSNNPLCTTKHLFPGESLGVKPPFLVRYFNSIGFTILLLTLLINNFLYNKHFLSYCFKEEIKLK